MTLDSTSLVADKHDITIRNIPHITTVISTSHPAYLNPKSTPKAIPPQITKSPPSPNSIEKTRALALRHQIAVP